MVEKKIAGLLILVIMLMLSILLTYAGYKKGLWRFNNPDKSSYPIRGLDVSHHQGAIDWSEVSSSEFTFVYIKSTEGGDWKDKVFERNWREAQRNGFKVGAYHFFTLCKAGKIQAKNFIANVPLSDSALPPVIDLEYVGNCKNRPAREEFIRELSQYRSAVKEYYSHEPVLYTTYDFFDDYLKDTIFEKSPLWIRNVLYKPDLSLFHNPVMWQFADNARVKGINTPVDLNVFINFQELK